MASNWFAKMYATGELTSSTCYQGFTPNVNISLKAIRLWLVVYNNPVLTGLRANIYANRSSSPAGLIFSSTNTWDTSDILTDGTTNPYGYKEIYFEFTPRQLLGTETYYVSLSATSYTGTDSSHIAWVHSLLDPLYAASVTRTDQQVKNLATWPQYLALIGAEV
jgi:hypothetical protein